MKKIRIDKWLWSVRIFKSRTIANEACRKGRVKIREEKVKASHNIVIGDVVQVFKNGFNLSFEVVQLLEKRVSATLAQQAYLDHTPEAELRKYDDWFVGKAGAERRIPGAGRPTKRERREIDAFKDEELD